MSKSTLLSIIFYRTDILFSARSLFQLFQLLSYICLQRWDGKLQEINGGSRVQSSLLTLREPILNEVQWHQKG